MQVCVCVSPRVCVCVCVCVPTYRLGDYLIKCWDEITVRFGQSAPTRVISSPTSPISQITQSRAQHQSKCHSSELTLAIRPVLLKYGYYNIHIIMIICLSPH